MNSLRSRAVPAQVRPKQLTREEAEGLFRYVKPTALQKHGGPPWRPEVFHPLVTPFKEATTPRRSSREYLQLRAEALNCALTQPVVASHEEPGELINPSNGSQGVSVKGMHARAASRKAKREMGQRIARTFATYPEAYLAAKGRPLVSAFMVVVLTRISPRALDSDGLETAFKSVRDGIAAGLGIDDRSPLVRYVPSQEQGAPRECRVRAELHIQPKEQS